MKSFYLFFHALLISFMPIQCLYAQGYQSNVLTASISTADFNEYNTPEALAIPIKGAEENIVQNDDDDIAEALSENEFITVAVNEDENYLIIEDKKFSEGNEIYIYDADDEIIYQEKLGKAQNYFTPTDDQRGDYVIFILSKNGNYSKNVRFE